MKKALALVFVLAAVWLGGFWPERARRHDAEAARDRLASELAVSRQTVELGSILGRTLALKDQLDARNYGLAQSLASQLFDATRAGSEPVTPSQPALRSILEMRDPLTVAISKGDPASVEMVRGIERRLRSALGYPIGEAPAPSPAANPASVPATLPEATP